VTGYICDEQGTVERGAHITLASEERGRPRGAIDITAADEGGVYTRKTYHTCILA
jgi:hypothetical protein